MKWKRDLLAEEGYVSLLLDWTVWTDNFSEVADVCKIDFPPWPDLACRDQFLKLLLVVIKQTDSWELKEKGNRISNFDPTTFFSVQWFKILKLSEYSLIHNFSSVFLGSLRLNKVYIYGCTLESFLSQLQFEMDNKNTISISDENVVNFITEIPPQKEELNALINRKPNTDFFSLVLPRNNLSL